MTAGNDIIFEKGWFILKKIGFMSSICSGKLSIHHYNVRFCPLEDANYEVHELENIVCDLQWLYDLSMEKCIKRKLEPEKCYVVWWINF